MPVDKPFAGGEWTQARFFGFLRSNFRRLSQKWPPLQGVLVSHRRPYAGENKRQKWEYLCFACGNYFPRKEVAVDHVVECGSLRDWADVEPFLRRLLVEEDGLAILCHACHEAKPSANAEVMPARTNDADEN